MNKQRFLFAPVALALSGVSSVAQEPAPVVVSSPPTSGSFCLIIPALTQISVEIVSEVGSKVSKTGDIFAIRLAAPILVGGKQLVPAGATGSGEVIHAKRAGGMGAAGELVLAARYLQVDGRRLPLRSLRLPTKGVSNINTVNTLALAGGAVGLVGFFISGGQIVIPSGTIAEAKVAADFAVPEHADPSSADKTTTCPELPTKP